MTRCKNLPSSGSLDKYLPLLCMGQELLPGLQCGCRSQGFGSSSTAFQATGRELDGRKVEYVAHEPALLSDPCARKVKF